MTTFLRSPASQLSARTFYNENTSIRHTRTNLSGATMLDIVNSPPAHHTSAKTNLHEQQPSNRKRSSYASTTKSQLRKTNSVLIDLLQDVHQELTMHRSMMLDMQSRLSTLESAAQPQKARSATVGSRQVRNHPSQTTWSNHEVHPNFARSCEPPFNPDSFLRSPTRFSGFDFNFDLLRTIPNMPSTTPAVDDIPDLTPTSNKDRSPRQATPDRGGNTFKEVCFSPSSDPTTMYHEAVSDIKERIVEFDYIKIPKPPILQSPPRSLRSKATSAFSRDDDLTALPQMPPPPPLPVTQPSQSQFKGIKRMFTYKALLRPKTSESQQADRRSGSSLRC